MHIGAVLNRCNSNWKKFSHHDCGLNWWRAWNAFAYNPRCPDISQFLLLLESKKISGPKFVGKISEINDTPFPVLRKLDSILHYDRDHLAEIFGEETADFTQDTNFVDAEFLYTQETYHAESQVEEDGWGAKCDAAFEGFMDPGTDKTGVVARELLKHDVQAMYDALDEFNKLGLGIPKADEIRKKINEMVDYMRNVIRERTVSKKENKRPLGDVHYIADEIAKNKYCRRSFHSKNC